MWSLFSALTLLFVVLWGVWLMPSVGISWDEHYHIHWGAEKWQNYADLFGGEISLSDFLALKHSSVHPGFFDLLLQGVIRIFALEPNMASHCLSFSFGIGALLGTCLLGRHLLGARGGFIALLLLICTPRFFGHMWMNPKDIPFAACYIWALYFLIRAIQSFPRPSWKWIVGLGVCTGLSLGVRVAGLLIPAYYGCAALLYWLSLSDRKFTEMTSLAWRGCVAGLVAYLAALPFWPTLWPAGGEGTMADAVGLAHQFDWNGAVLFDGAYYLASDLPSYYLPQWLLISLPEVVLSLLLVGVFVGGGYGYLLVTRRASWRTTHLPWLLVVLAGCFPIVYVLIKQPLLYDGMRHFMFILSPLIVIAAGVLHLICNWCERHQGRIGLGVHVPMILVVFGCLMTGLTAYSGLHPYYYIYFNSLAGGLPEASKKYETDYWGMSYREAIVALDTLLEDAEIGSHTMAISGAPEMVKPFLNPQSQLIESIEDADFYVAYTRYQRHRLGRGDAVVAIVREGVLLNLIWDQRVASEALGGDPVESH